LKHKGKRKKENEKGERHESVNEYRIYGEEKTGEKKRRRADLCGQEGVGTKRGGLINYDPWTFWEKEGRAGKIRLDNIGLSRKRAMKGGEEKTRHHGKKGGGASTKSKKKKGNKKENNPTGQEKEIALVKRKTGVDWQKDTSPPSSSMRGKKRSLFVRWGGEKH